MTLSIEEALASPTDRLMARQALRHRWCFPIASEAREHIEQLLGEPLPAPDNVLSGEVCLVSAASDGAGALWRLRLGSPRDKAHVAPDVPFSDSTQLAAECAWYVAARALNVVVQLDSSQHPREWSARFIVKNGNQPKARLLDGQSYGLGFVLAAASWLLDEPIATDIVALATISDDGRLGNVDRLEAKLRLLDDWALGVRRVLVAKSQLEQATELLAGRSAIAPRVEGYANVTELLARLFPEPLTERVRRRWREDPTQALRVTNALFARALDDRGSFLAWGAAAEAARTLQTTLRDADAGFAGAASVAEAITRADITERIARRHVGQSQGTRIDYDDASLASLTRPLRLLLVAQITQSVADSGDLSVAELLSAVDRARGYLVAPSEMHREDLIVLGAIGRALAVAEKWQDAEAVLRCAVDGWRGLFRFAQASRSLCEYLRVLAASGKRDALQKTVGLEVEEFLQQPDTPQSVCFVRLSAGRALIATREAEKGLAQLDERAARWVTAPDHVRFARWRWQARAFDLLGDHKSAEEAREQLEGATRESAAPDPNRYLCRLDAVLADSDTGDSKLEAIVEELLQHPDEASVFYRLSGGIVDRASARRIADLYPY